MGFVPARTDLAGKLLTLMISTCHVKKREKLENIHLVGWSSKIPFTYTSLIPGVFFSSYRCLDNGTWDNAPPQNA
jgi:hypothetical protein